MGVSAGLLDEQVVRFDRSVGRAAGVEVGEQLFAPGVQGAAESGDLADRAVQGGLDGLLRAGARPVSAVGAA